MNPDLVDEAGLQDATIDAMHVLGWLVAHFRPALTKKGWRTPVSADGKGFVDVVAVHKKQKRMLAIEFKGKRGRLGPEQKIWAEHFQAVASATVVIEYHLWTPNDWPDRIMEVLSAKAR
jgi:hypothetical protein